ncbi:hypothetical protein RJ641_026990 [Dillenia turbinata]|uniref:Uncharacterized protein n=1 Tax=Dillenia turbinata TaxID=194707 RepID=A0AAN8ZP88_9MAGN
MASPSDLSTQKETFSLSLSRINVFFFFFSFREAALRKQNRGSPVKFLIPLFYAPVLPLIRIAFRRNPVLRDRLFYGTLAGAFAHGFYLVYPFSLIFPLLPFSFLLTTIIF